MIYLDADRSSTMGRMSDMFRSVEQLSTLLVRRIVKRSHISVRNTTCARTTWPWKVGIRLIKPIGIFAVPELSGALARYSFFSLPAPISEASVDTAPALALKSLKSSGGPPSAVALSIMLTASQTGVLCGNPYDRNP